MMAVETGRTESGGEPGRQVRGVPAEGRGVLLPVAGRVFWWGDPEEWLEDAVRFAAQVMTYGDLEDTRATLGVLGEEFFEEVLKSAPPGVFDERSWHYWHLRYGKEVPPLPRRRFEEHV